MEIDPFREQQFDNFLTNQVERMLQTRGAVSRLALIKALRQTTEVGLKDAKTVVDSFCVRKKVLLEPQSPPYLVLLWLLAALLLLAYLVATATVWLRSWLAFG